MREIAVAGEGVRRWRDALKLSEMSVRRLGADLVVEVVSPDKPERDLVDKRDEYAEAQIPEYWIVNPQNETITVLRLEGSGYVEHGVFGRSAIATSVVLEGFSIVVDAVFDAE